MIKIEKQNILMVDDRPENLLALENLLESPDLNIFKALSGNEALSLVLEHDFALVLLDVQMPEIDGFEIARLMRGNSKTKNIPIIFITAISKDEEYVFKGYGSGAVDYLYKPIIPEILKSKVKVFCELYRQNAIIKQQLKENEEKNEILKKQLDEIKTLRGLLPICASCKKIRNDEGLWEAVEMYIHRHSEADFTHSICPACLERLYPEHAAKILPKNSK